MNPLEIIPFAGFIALVFLITGRIFFLKRKGVNVSSGKHKSWGKKVLLYLVFLPVLMTWIFEIVKPAFQLSVSFLPEMVVKPTVSSTFLQVSGAVFIFAALILMILVLLHFKTSLRFGLDKNNPGDLVTSGIFSVSRNPFFLSLNLYFIGVAFIFPNLFFIGFVILAMVGIHFFILKEERFLNDVYSEAYSRYSQKVNRYFGKN